MTATTHTLDAHTPVLCAKVCACLLSDNTTLPQRDLQDVPPNAKGHFLDATFGRGGYTKALFEQGATRITAIDRDEEAISFGQKVFQKEIKEERLFLHHAKFSDLDRYIPNKSLEGVVFDVGVSSPQLDTPERGFSFLQDGPLDMRMGLCTHTAADFLNTAGETEIADVLFNFGGERKSRSLAKRIVQQRTQKPFRTTQDVVALFGARAHLDRAGRGGAIHPATRTFQALRILVNDELSELQIALHKAANALVTGGRLVCVAFHSAEDRIVKHFLRPPTTQNASRHVPQSLSNNAPRAFDVKGKQPIKPSFAEIKDNPRARSARLRWGIKRGDAHA